MGLAWRQLRHARGVHSHGIHIVSPRPHFWARCRLDVRLTGVCWGGHVHGDVPGLLGDHRVPKSLCATDPVSNGDTLDIIEFVVAVQGVKWSWRLGRTACIRRSSIRCFCKRITACESSASGMGFAGMGTCKHVSTHLRLRLLIPHARGPWELLYLSKNVPTHSNSHERLFRCGVQIFSQTKLFIMVYVARYYVL